MIVVFGSTNLDLIFPVATLPKPGETVLGRDLRMEPGGKGANQAVAAARDGASAVFAGCVGSDVLGEGALRAMIGNGIDLSRVRRLTGVATGCASICVDDDGRNMIAVASGANLHARADQVEDALLTSRNTIVLQMEVPPAETAVLIRRAKARGARTVLNLAPAAPIDGEALRALDVLVVNDEEAAWLATHLATGDNAASLRGALGVDVVVTRGEAGLDASGRDGDFRIEAIRVDVVDTTAAGDCFTGVLAAGLDIGLNFNGALTRANAAAALACTKRGTQESLPDRAAIDAALRR